ncbi:MAG TPA: hypothetical protein VK760_15160 [Candidatus Acidoferrales bacterium]|nr:hypothetical protein [Candidatus Acidoferrales bacterium]
MRTWFSLALVAALAGAAPPATAAPSTGEQQLKVIQSLSGSWEYKGKAGVLRDEFHPFANGTAVLGEEFMNGTQITSTIFYVVDGRLLADHYCDYKNQPFYTAAPSTDPSVIDFEFRSATNLESNPMHFHSTIWKIADSTHMTQDWDIEGGKTPHEIIHMTFVRTAG